MSEVIKLHERVASLETTVQAIAKQGETHTVLLKKIHDDLSLYKMIIKMAKAIGLTAVFIIAFKFGDIKGLWH